MSQYAGLTIPNSAPRKRMTLLAVLYAAAATIGLSMLSFFIATAGATPDKFDTNSTTLDACGYFSGIETPRTSRTYTKDGIEYTETKGTWTGVRNSYAGPVASLGEVKGAFSKVTYTDNGYVYGTESFTSNAGKVDQVYSYTTAFTDFNVDVKANRDLSFLTSNTNGQCYTGPYPRP